VAVDGGHLRAVRLLPFAAATYARDLTLNRQGQEGLD